MELKKAYEQRRAVNSFDAAKPLPQPLLKEIIDTAVLAPSAFNLQPWRIIAVTSEESKQKLHPLAFGQPKILEAPATLILIGDREAYGPENSVWEELRSFAGEEGTAGAMGMAAQLYGTSEERKVKFAESNTGLLGMSIMYAAQALGVDSHPMSGMDFQAIKEAFALKESEDVVMLIALGYRDEAKELYPRRLRKGWSEIVTEL